MGRRTSNDGLENHLRELRASRGLTQSELADRTGITRQAVKAIESSQYTPNASVALRLAAALGCRVEDVFHLERRFPEVQARITGEGSRPGERLAVARVGQMNVARPLAGTSSFTEALVPADGILADRADTVGLLSPPDALDHSALMLGCDPSLSLLSDRITLNRSGERLLWLHASSQSALDALAAGTAHIAGSHFPADDGDENLRHSERALSPRGGIVVTYAVWQQGLVTASGNPHTLRRVEDLARQDIRLINREIGSGSRRLLDQLLGTEGIPSTTVNGYSTEAPSHAAVARAVASGQADAGIALEVVAQSFGLGFVPLAEVRFDLVIPGEHVKHPTVQVMLDVLQGRSLRADLGALPGYDVGRTGSTILNQQAA